MDKELPSAAQELAARIMVFSRDQLIGPLRYLDRVFFRMAMVPDKKAETFGVDGETIYYNAEFVLKVSKKEKNYCARAFLHMVLHCLFSHPFQYEFLNQADWNFAADIAVEKTILDLDVKPVSLESDAQLRRWTDQLHEEVPMLTAEKIYDYLRKHPGRAKEWTRQAKQFRRDDHRFWIPPKETVDETHQGTSPTETIHPSIAGCHDSDEGNGEGLGEPVRAQQPGKNWADASQNVKTDLETFSSQYGTGAGSMLLNLKATLRDKYDYREFLKKFTVLNEEMHLNDDEFDYNYYTYGMRLYGNMPLVEPLEYRESNRIREFVIAIDTSGSCQGSLVEQFLKTTYSILKSKESFSERVNIHIIQCDSKVQSDTEIRSDEEFERYMENVQLFGFGGTDFRPVFEYVDRLVRKGVFQNLKGLLYLTDGQGTFPEKIPAYKTAFIFIENGFPIPKVPMWAIRQVFQEDEIK